MTEQKEFDQNQLIGLTIEEAIEIYPNIRVVKINGNPLVCTMDYRIDRLNVEVVDRKISIIQGFG